MVSEVFGLRALVDDSVRWNEDVGVEDSALKGSLYLLAATPRVEAPKRAEQAFSPE